MSEATDKEDDLCLARDLLMGRMGEMGETTYLKGEEALRARAALARLLLAGPLDPKLAGMLAAVFEPDPTTMSFGRALARSGCESVLATAAGWQTVDFKRRSNKRSVPMLRDETVGSWMQQRLDDKTAVSVKDAKRQAMKEFKELSLTPGMVKDIWLEWLRMQRNLAAAKETVGSWMQQRLDDKTAANIKDAKRQAMKKWGLLPPDVVDQIWLEWLDRQRVRAAAQALTPDKP